MTDGPACAEAIFEALSLAIDAVPLERTELFLSKLCLLLALQSGEPGRVAEAIDIAQRDLS